MKLGFSIQKKLFLSHFLAVLLVSGSVGTYFYVSAVKSLLSNLQTRLQNTAALVSQAIDAEELGDIRDEASVDRPAYQKYLHLLRQLKGTNQDVAFLYVMRLEGGRVFFVMDSDETAEQALPGREYTAGMPALKDGFNAPAVDEGVYTDEWGAFMSGYAPLKNGQGSYLVGVDMRANEVAHKVSDLRLAGLLSFCFSVILALAFSLGLAGHFNRPIQALVASCNAIRKGQIGDPLAIRTGDELNDLIGAFNTMSTELSRIRAENLSKEQDLLQTKLELEERVVTRTQELLAINGQLKREIMERRHAEEALTIAARTDPLTGLLNRRAIIEHLEYQVVQCRRAFRPFVILLADLDDFKRVNDTYGHQVGDEALKNATDRIRSAVREQDLVSRWGGEEFLLMLPGTGLDGGAEAAEKIRRNVDASRVVYEGRPITVTISIGVAAYRPSMTLDDCIKAADDALYAAKRAGRNRVMLPEA